MPVAWRYLLAHFLKITLFCVLAFVALLLTMRLDDIAHFSALGASWSHIALFTFYQIPYILPIALPISCLIASYTLVQRLSGSHELTAMRACGFAIRNILTPILLAATVLGLTNFWIVSELATTAHLTNNKLKSELRSINPLLLLHNKHLMRLKGIYFEALGSSRFGEAAEDVVLAVPNHHHQRLNLLLANQLSASSSLFTGQGVTLLTSSPAEDDEQFDQLFIENMEKSVTEVQDFAQLLQQKVWTINNDYLKMSFLLIRIDELNKALAEASDPQERKVVKGQLYRSLSELIRRFALAVGVVTFTLMGAAFGLNISRRRSYWTLYLAIGLASLYLGAFFLAKGADQNLALAASLYTIPNIAIIAASLYVLNRISTGREV